MAATYRAVASQIDFAANKNMLSVFNESGSAVIVKVYRIWVLNHQVTAVTGVLTNLEIRKLSASTGGTTITPTKHDTSSTTLTTVTCATNTTYTPTDMYKRVVWSTDEPRGNSVAATLNEFQAMPPIALIWSQGYADANTDPIILNATEGVAVVNTGAIVGKADLMIEFTAA